MIRRALLAMVLLAAAPGVLAAPEAELWERWTANDPDSTLSVDHGAWDAFLGAYVVAGADGINRLAYGNADRAALSAYIERTAAVPVSRLKRDRQRALWINLYNALTVRVVLDHYPVDSIRDIDISPGLFADGPWGRKLVTVEGQAVGLDDIEHRILRPIWRDARLHYVLNCAALGCPDLQPTAFTAANTEFLLEAAARTYVNHPRGASIEGGRLVVSSVYDWYGVDFGGTDAAIIAHLRSYAEPPLKAGLDAVTRIAGDRYDWSLNDAR